MSLLKDCQGAINDLARQLDVVKLFAFLKKHGIVAREDELLNFQCTREEFIVAIHGLEEAGNRQLAFNVRLAWGPEYYQWQLLDGKNIILTSGVKYPTLMLCQIDAVKHKSLLQSNPILRIIGYINDDVALGTVKELVDVSVDTRKRKREAPSKQAVKGKGAKVYKHGAAQGIKDENQNSTK